MRRITHSQPQVSLTLDHFAASATPGGAASKGKAGDKQPQLPLRLEQACSDAAAAAESALASAAGTTLGDAVAQELGRAATAVADSASKAAEGFAPAEQHAVAALCRCLFPAAARACGVPLAAAATASSRKGGGKQQALSPGASAGAQGSLAASSLASAALAGYAAATDVLSRGSANAAAGSAQDAEEEQLLRDVLSSPLLSESAITRAGATVRSAAFKRSSAAASCPMPLLSVALLWDCHAKSTRL